MKTVNLDRIFDEQLSHQKSKIELKLRGHRQLQEEIFDILQQRCDQQRNIIKNKCTPDMRRQQAQHTIRKAIHTLIADDMKKARAKALEINEERYKSGIRNLYINSLAFLKSIDVLQHELEKQKFPDENHRKKWQQERERKSKRRGKKFGNNNPSISWKGADTIISETPLEVTSKGKSICVTPHAYSLAELFLRIRNLDPGIINFMNKMAFYGKIAEKAHKTQQQNPDISEHQLLLAALDEGRHFVEQCKEDTRNKLASIQML